MYRLLKRLWGWTRKTIWNDFWTALRARFKKLTPPLSSPELKPLRVRSNIRYNRMYIGKLGYKRRLPKMKQVGNFRVPLPC